jgi:scyllo-inositol 2-dehydrogenase (NADP+)
MVNVALAGLGKMGLSHLSIVRAHPDVKVVGVCDSTAYLLDVLGKYTQVATFVEYASMLDEARPDAVIVATPTYLHADMVRTTLRRGIHVFCEKPLSLDPGISTELAGLSAELGLVTQVGYHNRYVASFAEVKRLLDLGAIGRVSHAMAEAYGPVVLKPKGGTWRSRRSSGGGALYDYAAHPIDLLTWYFGPAQGVSGSTLNAIFSAETEDEVYTSIRFADGVSSQLSVNWSDESQRKMSTSVTIWGSTGRIYADRQEIQVHLRDTATPVAGYQRGWNVRYTTELTQAVGFYLRGEEYSAQMADFVARVAARQPEGISTFATAARTDDVIDMIQRDAQRPAVTFARTDEEAPGTPLVITPTTRRSIRQVLRRRR